MELTQTSILCQMDIGQKHMKMIQIIAEQDLLLLQTMWWKWMVVTQCLLGRGQETG